MIHGSLLTLDFLQEGIAETAEWAALRESEFNAFKKIIQTTFANFPVDGRPIEAQTEDELIVPILEAIGWTDRLRNQAATRRREDVPDYLLFRDTEAKQAANRERRGPAKYRHGTAILEAKAWDVPLDRGAPDLFNQAAPSSQMLRYLTRVDIESNGAIQWGILTNGRLWRLYYQRARSSRSEEFLEIDLAAATEVRGISADLFAAQGFEPAHVLKLFLMLFRRPAFVPGADDARTFLEKCLSETREWEARVSQTLGETVFNEVFPKLAQALASADPERPAELSAAYLDELRRATLTLLYRLLFVLYAEDRNLLPSHEPGYEDYSLRKLRAELIDKFERRERFSGRAPNIWNRLKTIFHLIDRGDKEIGLPPYNGGLFDPAQHPLLERTAPPDDRLAPLIDLLSRRLEGEVRKRINYRDLSVQHLGSIYEKLLEHGLFLDKDVISTRLNPFARKGSGSYYTHEDLVRLIIERTVGPLIEERITAFDTRSAALASERSPRQSRVEKLVPFDPAERILDLKVCDPAMGSGHFLVSLVDYVADRALEAMAHAAAETASWTSAENPYASPLAGRLETIRKRILEAAGEHGWRIDAARLQDRHIVRRMILKRMIYGVDKNPMAVELAKVALWLHTFTVGAPLSFLDHHLRTGDSLFGEWVRPVEDMLKERSTLFLNPSVAKAKNSARGMLAVENLTDADIAEVKTSATTFSGVEEATAPLANFMSLVHALKWNQPTSKEEQGAVTALYLGDFGDPVAIASGAKPRKTKGDDVLNLLLAEILALIAEQRFLHWEVAFPGVWTEWETAAPAGGFDAVIGNPPWDRIKLQEVEWFATRRPEIAHAVRAADRSRMIRALERASDPLWQEFVTAKERAERAAEIARDCGDYPLLSRGDINIYALFVERGHQLIKPDGIVGFVVPSGIASDLSASAFFKSVATSGRISTLFDFENRGVFFPDVHRSFKFSVFVTGGPKRKFEHTDCGFFLHSRTDIQDRTFPLSADDFARVNPNTGTAPVFRTRRDADITRAIYERLPVLVRHTDHVGQAVWPVRYVRMFDMTNDSKLFRTRAELEKDGFYLTDGNRMRRGKEEAVSLYEGKMVQMYDHRAASVVVNPKNLNRPAQPETATEKQHADPSWLPNPQFWIEEKVICPIDPKSSLSADDWRKAAKGLWPVSQDYPGGLSWTIGFKDVTAPTNIRTMIASALPFAGFGNTLPILMPVMPELPPEDAPGPVWDDWHASTSEALWHYRQAAPLLLANLNSLPFDYLARQKVQGQHLNWYIVEQLPVIPPKNFEGKIGTKELSEIIRQEVLHLTYTAHDMQPFARDLGYKGPPFAWDEEDRRHRKARLDALFFHLYGIGEDDAAYILDTFPIVREQDMAEFGRFRTKELVLGYLRAVKAGDVTTVIAA